MAAGEQQPVAKTVQLADVRFVRLQGKHHRQGACGPETVQIVRQHPDAFFLVIPQGDHTNHRLFHTSSISAAGGT